MGFWGYLLRRLILLVPMVWVLLTAAFVMIRILPGDPVALVVGPDASEQVRQQVAQELGLNKPLYIQYFNYIWGVLHGNLGTSIQGQSVSAQIGQRLPVSLELVFFGIIIASIMGILIGAFSASRPKSKSDVSSRLFLILIGAFFTPFLGLLFQYVFGVYFRVLPATGIGALPSHSVTGFPMLDSLLLGQFGSFYSQVRHILLPALTLGIPVSGVIGRLARSYMLETYSQDYIISARQRGISESVVLRDYSLRNAMLPLTTTIGLIAAGLVGGSVLIEQVFNLPGMGLYLTQAILSRNYPQVQGAIVVYALFVGLIGIIVDLTYGFLDPRVKM